MLEFRRFFFIDIYCELPRVARSYRKGSRMELSPGFPASFRDSFAGLYSADAALEFHKSNRTRCSRGFPPREGRNDHDVLIPRLTLNGSRSPLPVASRTHSPLKKVDPRSRPLSSLFLPVVILASLLFLPVSRSFLPMTDFQQFGPSSFSTFWQQCSCEVLV